MIRTTRLLRTVVCPVAALMFVANVVAFDAGDLAIIAFSSDDPDALTFVVLRDIPAGADLRFTDSGWQSAGGFRANEGGIQFTAAAALAPGTIISRSDPFTSGGWSVNNAGVGANGFALSTSGDQILAFVGDAGSPAFLHAVHFDSTTYANATNSNTTALPVGLAVGTTAVDLPEVDNGYYDGPTAGTPQELLAAIGDPGNWTISDSPISAPAWSFDVLGDGPVVQSVSLPGSTFDVGEMITVSVAVAPAPEAAGPVTIELTSGAFGSVEILSISHPDTNGFASVVLQNEGTWSVIATATSNGAGSVESAPFTVGSSMTPPTVYAGADRAVELVADVVTVALSGATADDVNGLSGAMYDWTPMATDGLAGWQNRSGPMATSASPAAAQATFEAVGEYVLTLTVIDSTGLAASDSVTITVSEPAPADQYDPPPGYYSAATSQGNALHVQLSQIITAGHVQQSYGDFKTSAARYDADLDTPGNILLAYNRESVPSDWDGGQTWNREHVWPQSLQPGSASDGSTGNLGDPHALRPVNPSINSSRSNKPFGTFVATGLNGHEGSYYFPGDADKGDIARSQFYSATRYMGTLSLVSGIPSGNTMGDLDAMIRWHYTDVPDDFERRRNQLIYEDQFNRNPFVDRPEFAWSVFGDGANDSTLYVSMDEPADGSSDVVVDFPPIIVGGPLPPAAPILLRKSGDDPTYYSVSVLGDATCDATGRHNAFDFGARQRMLTVGIGTLPAGPGVRSGAVIIDNLDVSSQGPGQGAGDGNDVIDVSLVVVDHSEGSFSPSVDSDELSIDFGPVPAAAGMQAAGFGVYNLAAPSGFTADLEVLLVTQTGDDEVLTTDAAEFNGLPAGVGVTYAAWFDPSFAGPGKYTAEYTLVVADEDLPGATPGAPLILTLMGEVTGAVFPFDDEGDGDVDELDAARFAGCVGGPGGGWLEIGCANHDWDEDGDVDLVDAAALQTLFTGSNP